MEHQYDTLVKILDGLRHEAPDSYKSYKPEEGDEDGLVKARSLAFIHLLLKVKFGIIDFLKRHQLITDGTQDGGLDAYFIDEERKRLYLIQSKFRNNAKNFIEKPITTDELIKIEVSRITKGFDQDSKEVSFNSKIKDFQSKIRDIRDIAKYEYIVLLLGNVYKLSDEQIRRAIDNSHYEIYDALSAYENLIFPLVTGMYYDPDEIIIKLELSQKESPRLNQKIETDFGQFNVTAIFVSTKEIGRVMLQYKNAILKYNPRNFLSFKKESVNADIRRSIVDQNSNNFAILNNGITLLSENVNISESTGKQNEGQLILTKPQILNGGQTAFTLSSIHEEFKHKAKNPLDGKEVLLKIITPIAETESVAPKFIELISNATNQQNEVSEADRRSNHDIQISIQQKIYLDYGYFYERKAGEFYDGIKDGIITRNLVINRLTFIKAYWAFLGEPAAARRTSEKNLFREDKFYSLLHSTEKYYEMFFAYLLFNKMEQIEKDFKSKFDSVERYGYSLLYGKWAVIASIGILKPFVNKDVKEIFKQAENEVYEKLDIWKSFDDFIKQKNKDTKYFQPEKSNYELYYKINKLDDDVKEFFLR
ncbi:MAG: AIPR family protein [Deltaproteobacteria bacterium]|nr:AIPR family protein [Deltaproteobacteria bacterium]